VLRQERLLDVEVPTVRLTRFHLVLLGGLILAIVGPVAFTQQGPGPGRGGFGPGGWGGGRGGFGGGFRRPDPAEQFKQYSGGKDVITVSEVQVPERMARWMSTEQLRERMNTFLQKKGITNGKMTQAQFEEYQQDQRQAMMERFRQGGFNMGKGGPGGPGGGAPTKGGTSSPPGDLDGQARDMFKRLDRNNDGVLTTDEMDRARRWGSDIASEWQKYDLNKDGKIDLNEYIEYYKASAKRGPTMVLPGEESPPPEEEKKAVVYRAGNLPPELKTIAPWFEQLDKDKDGQVGLYEWKASGKDVKDFLAMDANGDGFVTVEEMLRFHKATTKKDPKKGNDGKGGPAATPGRGGFGAAAVPGMGPGRGRGPGGPGGGGWGGAGGGRGGNAWGGPGGGGGGRGGRNRMRGNWGGMGGGMGGP
jgi:Ca2+-binding EF-hand superfamily protein